MSNNHDNNHEQVEEFLNQVLVKVERNANRVARLFQDEDKALGKLADDDARSLATEAKERLITAVQQGDYNSFAFCMSTLAFVGVLKGDRDKWKQLPMITDLVWRGMRDALKGEITNAVDEFLKEFE
jgi:hypothetical protein